MRVATQCGEVGSEVVAKRRPACEARRGADHAGADSALEVAPDPLPHRIGAAIPIEAGDVEAEGLRPLPEVRIVRVRPVG